MQLQDLARRPPNIEDGLSTSAPSVALSEGSNRPVLSLDSVATSGSAEAAEPLLKVWSELQEENMRLRQKRVQLEARQMRSRLASRSPTNASPGTGTSPAALASRNRSPQGEPLAGAAGGPNLGTGFRWNRATPSQSKDEQA